MSNRLPKFSVPGCCVSPTLERRQRLADAPLLYRASYNDREQGLTDAEVYAARRQRLARGRGQTERQLRRHHPKWRVGYSTPGRTTGESSPASCPACDATLVRYPSGVTPSDKQGSCCAAFTTISTGADVFLECCNGTHFGGHNAVRL
jgi:hypothetical protein